MSIYSPHVLYIIPLNLILTQILLGVSLFPPPILGLDIADTLNGEINCSVLPACIEIRTEI